MNKNINSTHTAVPKNWAWHYRALLKVREILLRERDDLTQAFQSPLERGGTDGVGVANDRNEHDLLLAAVRIEEMELAEVDHALARLLNGTYGVCEKTGHAIDEARLRAIPWTRFSHQAAIDREKMGKPSSISPAINRND